jgi:hypothetical protein
MIFETFYNDFNRAYHNEPLPFAETSTGDGSITTYKLNYYPLADYQPYQPQVYVNAVIQTENINYTVDYREGIIYFNTAPTNGHVIVINGFCQKFNLYDVISSYDRSLEFLSKPFPIKTYQKVDYTDVTGATVNDSITELDLTVSPYSDFTDFLAIYQNKNDIRPVPFEKREKTLMFTLGTSGYLDSNYIPGDYHSQTWIRKGSNVYSTLKYPFYIHGIKKYTKIPFSSPLHGSLQTTIILEDVAYEQAMILTAILCYEGRLHYNDRLNSTSLRKLTMIEIRNTLRDLNAKLIQDIQFKGLGKGFFQDSSPGSISIANG